MSTGAGGGGSETTVVAAGETSIVPPIALGVLIMKSSTFSLTPEFRKSMMSDALK
jgi:hypothetical protein